MFLKGEDVVVLGLPRGGVPVAYEVARALGVPLDVIVVRKIGVPFQPELAMGAIGEDGALVLNDDVIRMARVSKEEFAAVESRERAELERRTTRLRGVRRKVQLAGRAVIVVDDGIATGATARAACQVAQARGAARVLLAVPVAARESVAELRQELEVVCLENPTDFWAVGQFYDNFREVSDEEVTDLLADSNMPVSRSASAGEPLVDVTRLRDEEVELLVAGARLAGHLTVPEQPTGMVVFAHGSGSSRHSPRNRFVADVLNRSRMGTLLFDLLTDREELDRSNVFDIELLGSRLGAVTTWVAEQRGLQHLPIGYFGASTGAGAALWAAAQPGCAVAAVVSRGGRPDLAGPRLPDVKAPTLLIVGGLDEVVLELNHQAQTRLRCESRLAVVPGATHLFSEPGTLLAAAELAREWLDRHFAGVASGLRHTR